MTKYFKLQTFLIVLMIMGSLPGIYAINNTKQDSSMSISKINNNNTHGSKIIYVAKNGTDRNDGLTPTKPKRNIENAIDDANPGDTIRVASGTYQCNLQITKNITLIGDNQNNTIIDGQKLANSIYISGATVTITNFTIKNGKQNRNKGISRIFGGGIYNEGTLYLKNSTITDNDAEYGGGIYNLGIINISGVTIKNNKADTSGGGIENDGTASIEDSIVMDNTAQRYGGGGISNLGTGTLKRVSIKNNRADFSGGINNRGKMTIEDSTITNNIANGLGGGIGNQSILYMYGSTISNNTGGGIYNGYKAYIDDITVINGNNPNNFEGEPFIPA